MGYIVYFIEVNPFESQLQNWVEKVNDIFILLLVYAFYGYNYQNQDSDSQFNLGIFMLCMIFSNFGMHALILLFQVFESFKSLIKRC